MKERFTLHSAGFLSRPLGAQAADPNRGAEICYAQMSHTEPREYSKAAVVYAFSARESTRVCNHFAQVPLRAASN